jgi:OmpA-OmpF porin, OOP family
VKLLLVALLAGLGVAPPTGDVRIDPPLIRPGAVYPVEAITFPEATGDGAVVESSGSIDMSADVMFEVDRAELTPRADAEIVRIVGELRSAVLTRADVVGYTDSTGSAAHNLELSKARAESVRAALAAALGPGVPITADGRGEADPVADNATAAGRAMNRRVRITYS